jgi:3-deoxy-D-manno-octulosonate 8-phosphate phosphatase (KDO 8-P phosphatase)
VQGASVTLPGYRRILDETGFRPGQVRYVGDDLPDLPVLLNCGLPVAVADACPEVRAAAAHVTRACGGGGAIREVVELILHGQGLWPRVVESFRGVRS